MKWIIIAEIVLTVLLFVGGFYAESTGRSADERLGSAFLFLGGGAMVAVVFLTLIGWWMWQVTFRG